MWVGVGERVAVAVGMRVLLAVMEGVRVGLEVGLGFGLGDEVRELLTLAGKVEERLKMGLGGLTLRSCDRAAGCGSQGGGRGGAGCGW